jgi:hypothetical protein
MSFGDKLRELFDDDVPEHGESEREHEEREREARERPEPPAERQVHRAGRIADRERGEERGDVDDDEEG